MSNEEDITKMDDAGFVIHTANLNFVGMDRDKLLLYLNRDKSIADRTITTNVPEYKKKINVISRLLEPTKTDIKRQAKETDKLKIENLISEKKREYKPAFEMYLPDDVYLEMRSDLEALKVRDTAVIDVALAIKISTLIETEEAPFLQLYLPSGRGKSFTIERINAILGKIPLIIPEGVEYHPSVVTSYGTPLNMIYSDVSADNADGIIWFFDDSRVSTPLVNFLLQLTGKRFCEDVIYKVVTDAKTKALPCPHNLRIFMSYAKMPQEFLDAGIETRVVSCDITSLTAQERSESNADFGIRRRIEDICEKWSKFWIPLYDAVYFKGKRSHVVNSESYTSGKKMLSYEDNRIHKHIYCLATAYAVLRDSKAILEGRDVTLTDEDIERAEDVIATTFPIEGDEYLRGTYRRNTPTYHIARECFKYCSDCRNPRTFNDILDHVMGWLESEKYDGNIKRTAERGIYSFINQETKHKNLQKYSPSKYGEEGMEQYITILKKKPVVENLDDFEKNIRDDSQKLSESGQKLNLYG